MSDKDQSINAEVPAEVEGSSGNLADVDFEKLLWLGETLADLPGLLGKLADNATGPALLGRLVDEWDSLSGLVSYSFSPDEGDEFTSIFFPPEFGFLTAALVAWCDNIHRGIDPLPLIRAAILVNRGLKPDDASGWRNATNEAAITTSRIRLWIVYSEARTRPETPIDVDFVPPLDVSYKELGELAYPELSAKAIRNPEYKAVNEHGKRGRILYRTALQLWSQVPSRSTLPLSEADARKRVDEIRRQKIPVDPRMFPVHPD